MKTSQKLLKRPSLTTAKKVSHACTLYLAVVTFRKNVAVRIRGILRAASRLKICNIALGGALETNHGEYFQGIWTPAVSGTALRESTYHVGKLKLSPAIAYRRHCFDNTRAGWHRLTSFHCKYGCGV